MCNQKTKKRIHNINRLLICLLSIAGFFGDGYQVTDLFFTLSIVLWIWLSEWDKLEASLMDTFSRRQKPVCKFVPAP